MNGIQLRGVGVDKNKESIIKRYNAGVEIHILAGEFNIKVNTLCRRLKKWGAKIRKGDYRKKTRKNGRACRKFSPELKAKMKYNAEVNRNSKRVKIFRTTETVNDRFLVRNILKKSRAVADE